MTDYLGNHNGGYFGGITGYTFAYNPNMVDGNADEPWFLPGGTASIYPSEYGSHHFDSFSGVEGFTLDVGFRNYLISTVSLSDTFESWRQKTNTEIISKLNKLKVYGATFGDGIMIANSTGGTLAIAFSGNVMRENVTFANQVSIGESLTVAGQSLVVQATTGAITAGNNINENIIILNHKETPDVGSRFSGLIIGGGATGEWYLDGSPINPVDLNNISDVPGDNPNLAAGDIDNAFAFDRPYWLHKQGLWRTKEGLWLEGKLLHQEVFGGTGGEYNHEYVGSTSDYYPNGPFGYTGSTFDFSNPFFSGGRQKKGPSGGVVRLFFGPTLAGYNFLDIDGRGGRAGVTGTAWHEPNNPGRAKVGGKTGSLVIGNTAGPLLDFDKYGYTNIYRGANKKVVNQPNHGFIFGECVRYTGVTHGYTFASAMGSYEENGDDLHAAEVVGVVSRIVDNNHFEMTMSGEIYGTTAEWNSVIVDDDSNGLVPGSVYFLSTFGGANVGLIQKQQPLQAGYVNKPVIQALDTIFEPGSNADTMVDPSQARQTAVILPYRGVYLSPTGCTAGSGEGTFAGQSGDDATQFELPYAGSDDFSIGDFVSVPNKGSTNPFELASATDFSKSNVMGVITHVNETIKFVRIATAGTIHFVTVPDWTSQVSRGPVYLSTTPGEATGTPGGNFSVKVGDMINNSTMVLRIQPPTASGDASASLMTSRVRGSQLGTTLRVLGNSAGTGETFDNVRRVQKNELVNPDFGIWQRGVGLTGGAAEGGSAGWIGTNNTYFADRWIRLSQTGTGPNTNNPFHGVSGGSHRLFDYLLKRGSFTKQQTEVEGHPDYYAIIKGGISFAGGTNSNEFYRVEQRIEDTTSFAGEVMTVSFYAKAGRNTGTCKLAWIQNLTGTTGAAPGATFGLGGGMSNRNGRGITANEIITPITNFSLSDSWARYAYSFFVPELSGAAGSSGSVNFALGHPGRTSDHFASLAFYTQLTSLPDNPDENIYFNEELHLAQVKLERGDISTPFERPSYNEELRRCWRFYQTSYEDGKFPGEYAMRTANIADTTGVHFMVGCSKSFVYELPERLRRKPIECNLWSPTGVRNEGFNVCASKDMRFTAGTKGSLGELRKTNKNDTNITCTVDSPHAIEIKALRGAARLDNVVVHYAVDADINTALPEQVTTGL